MSAPAVTNSVYLRNEQYRDDANLSARIDLHRRFTTNDYGWYRWVFDHFDVPADARVLEVGCGPGNLWHENRERVPSAWRITLTDLSPGMVEASRQRLAGMPQVTLQVADAHQLPFADAAFDAVIANHMLYHVPDLSRALSEIRRVLRPGGWLYAATNGDQHLRELDELLERHAPEAERNADARRFGLENGAELLRPFFAEITRDDYPDQLAVTKVEPLLAYLLSTSAKPHLSAERLARIEAEVAARITADGSFTVTKANGLFQGRR